MLILPIAILKAYRSNNISKKGSQLTFPSRNSLLREVSLADISAKNPELVNKKLFSPSFQSIFFDN